MKEIEVKIINIDKKDVEKKLVKLGAKKVFAGNLINALYDFKDRRLDKNSFILK